MRKRIAMRWRREALRRGAILSNEKMVFSKKELRENNLKRKHNGFSFCAEYNGWNWMICADDMLAAYKMFIEEIDYEHNWMEQAVDKFNNTPCGYPMTKEQLESAMLLHEESRQKCDTMDV